MEETIYRLTDRFLKDEEFSDTRNVIRAKDTATGEYALLKRWKKEDPRGINEISVRSLLHHKNITDFICSFEEHDHRFMACRWAEGVSLDEYVSDRETLGEEEALAIFGEIRDAILYLQSKEGGPLIHNDIKPGNIIVRRTEKGTFEVRLIDFETCIRSGSSGMRVYEGFETLPFGSFFFSSPESLAGEPSKESDIYSAGAVLGYMIFGKEFYEKTKECLSRGSFAVNIIKRCMQKDSRKRRFPKDTDPGKDDYEEDKTPQNEYIVAEEIIDKDNGNESGYEEKVPFEKEYSVQGSSEKDKDLPPERKKNESKVRNFKIAEKLTVCVEDNLCFSTELAYACGDIYGMKVLLFDTYPLKDRIDLYMLGRSPDEERDKIFSGACPGTGPGPDAWVRQGLLRIDRENRNLYVGTCFLMQAIAEGELSISDLYTWAYKNFDGVIVNIYKNTEDRLKYEIPSLFNYLIIAARPDLDEVDSAFEYYRTMSRRGKMYGNNMRYVAWDHIKGSSLPVRGITCLIGEDSYLGSVRYDEERYKMRNTGGVPAFYGRKASVSAEYEEILSKLLFGGRK